jgi:cbb3-type cytochrome oxidase cytochrome c subunit
MSKLISRFVLAGGLVAVFALTVGARQSLAQANSRVDPALAEQGRKVFVNRGCGFCHTVGRKEQRTAEGPDLAGVTERRTHDWLKAWLKNPLEMFGSDQIADAMLVQYRYVKMPNLKLSPNEIDALIAYLSQHPQP